jgi:hypothetical protein
MIEQGKFSRRDGLILMDILRHLRAEHPETFTEVMSKLNIRVQKEASSDVPEVPITEFLAGITPDGAEPIELDDSLLDWWAEKVLQEAKTN